MTCLTQAIGSKFNNKYAGTFGEIGCFSAHPLKNLNAIGDSGFLVTSNKYIYQKAKLFNNHGMPDRDHVKFFGYVSRMDTLQASILNFRLVINLAFAGFFMYDTLTLSAFYI